jgi:hypothetical protein
VRRKGGGFSPHGNLNGVLEQTLGEVRPSSVIIVDLTNVDTLIETAGMLLLGKVGVGIERAPVAAFWKPLSE